ncbi:helix-turn-helix transcriptional regulator [Pedobacter sp. UC225_65]|uniref:helix-turn-helix transcriptional regulator n=1 Tax=Pedobacter sp. UC225_65 TaxID=3350173 RepID=UPI00366D6C49
MKNNLRVQRAIKNITQAELADFIQVSRQTINTIESGKYVPSTVLALKMAKVFNVPVERSFNWKKEIENKNQSSLHRVGLAFHRLDGCIDTSIG